MRDFCYVVRYCYSLTAESREHRKVSGRGEIRAEKPLPPHLQLDSEERVLDFYTRCGLRAFELIRARAQLEDAFAIDSRQPCVAKLFLDKLGVTFE